MCITPLKWFPVRNCSQGCHGFKDRGQIFRTALKDPKCWLVPCFRGSWLGGNDAKDHHVRRDIIENGTRDPYGYRNFLVIVSNQVPAFDDNLQFRSLTEARTITSCTAE